MHTTRPNTLKLVCYPIHNRYTKQYKNQSKTYIANIDNKVNTNKPAHNSKRFKAATTYESSKV
jgi:hypothetical protein